MERALLDLSDPSEISFQFYLVSAPPYTMWPIRINIFKLMTLIEHYFQKIPFPCDFKVFNIISIFSTSIFLHLSTSYTYSIVCIILSCIKCNNFALCTRVDHVVPMIKVVSNHNFIIISIKQYQNLYIYRFSSEYHISFVHSYRP